MDLIEGILLSWDRQTAMVQNVAGLIDDESFDFRPGTDEHSLGYHLCHIHEVRHWWLSQIDKEAAAAFGNVFEETDGTWKPIRNLAQIREQLDVSAKAVRDVVERLLRTGAEKAGPYDHPMLFLNHMVWHEGWHVGEILLGLRQNGRGPTDKWEEKNLWELWRGPEN
jgi:uncharacterized damage-inducible protein DinB